MSWRTQADKIKREVRAEGFRWFLYGGLVTRQFKAAIVLLPPIFAALICLEDGLAKQVVVGVLVGSWFLYQIVLYAIGTVFISKKMDRHYNRKVHPKLSKEYRRP